uniref:Uncharacterized protein n=1 Tax=Oryza nivara TaxID=4536 RepID=A0A0E0G5D2_ORYNI
MAVAFTSPMFHRLPAEDNDAPASVSSSSADADEHRGLKVALRHRGRRSGRQGGWGKASAAVMEAVRLEEPERRRAKEEVGRRLEGWLAALSARLGGDDGDKGRRGGR